MSFMLFVQFHEYQGSKLVALDEIASKFGNAFGVENGEAWLSYAENEYPEMYGDFHLAAIDSFSVSSPPVSKSFWKSLFDVLTIEGATLMFPDFEGVIYANESTFKHLPSDMIDSMPEKVCVENFNQILELLENA